MIEPATLQQVERTFVRFAKRKLVYFGGCDYFRLSSHPVVLRALHTGLDRFGLNVAASRLTTGNHELYYQLENRLADFFDAESATLVSGGYITNLVVAQALAGSFSHALLDAKAHPSLSDAAKFLECPLIRFNHCDPEHLSATLKRLGPGAKVLVLTDGMFSHNGTTAPLKQYLQVLPKDSWILVDDAHGAGVLGETGQGSLEYSRVSRQRIIQTVTLSKAFGSFGGAVLGNASLRKRIVSRSSLFMASTPLPLPLANASLESLALLKKDRRHKKRLQHNTAWVKTELAKAAFPLPVDAPGPIIPVLPNSPSWTANLKSRLLKAGIHPPLIKYPNGPKQGYFRFVLSSEHTSKQLQALVEVLTTYNTASSTARSVAK